MIVLPSTSAILNLTPVWPFKSKSTPLKKLRPVLEVKSLSLDCTFSVIVPTPVRALLVSASSELDVSTTLPLTEPPPLFVIACLNSAAVASVLSVIVLPVIKPEVVALLAPSTAAVSVIALYEGVVAPFKALIVAMSAIVVAVLIVTVVAPVKSV